MTDKIDLAEYLKSRTKDEFEKLFADARDIYKIQLEKYNVPDNTVLKIEAAKDYVSNNLGNMDITTKRAYIRNEVAKYFGLDVKTANDIFKEYSETKQTNYENEEECNKNIQADELHLDTEHITHAKIKAIDILKSSKPMEFICNCIQTMHIGDERAIEGINLAIANQSCLNTQGIQIKLSGDSGGGKSHTAKSVCHCLRDNHIIESSLSAKAAYYMELKPGTILFSDDTDISEDMETVIKRSTTNYQDYTVHTTVKDGGSITLTIPPRILWLVTSVEDDVSDQLLNRQLIFNVDTSNDQKNRIFDMQIKEAMDGEIKTLQVTEDVLICREMWDIIKSKELKVRIPFAYDIEIMDKSNSRNFPMFLDMLKGYTIINHMQREIDEDGYVLAEKDDFYCAKSLFESQTESVLTKLNEKERRIIQVIGATGNTGIDLNNIAKATGLSYAVVRNCIKGRQNKQGGLLEKVPKLRMMEGSESESVRDDVVTTTTTKKKELYILSDFNGWDIFDTGFVYLKSDKEAN